MACRNAFLLLPATSDPSILRLLREPCLLAGWISESDSVHGWQLVLHNNNIEHDGSCMMMLTKACGCRYAERCDLGARHLASLPYTSESCCFSNDTISISDMIGQRPKITLISIAPRTQSSYERKDAACAAQRSRSCEGGIVRRL